MSKTRREWRGWGAALLTLVAATVSCGKTNTGAPSGGDGGESDHDSGSAAGGKLGKPAAGSAGGSAGRGVDPGMATAGKSTSGGQGGSGGVSGSAGKGGKSGGMGGSIGGGSIGVGGSVGGGIGTVSCEGRTCAPGQLCLSGKCACPAYAPSYCEAAQKCVNLDRDPDWCGDCDTACGSQVACEAGSCGATPRQFAEVPGCGSLALLRVGSQLYVLSRDTGTLSRLPLLNVPTPVEIATGLLEASAFAIEGELAYVAAGNSIVRVTLATGAAEVVTTAPARIYDVTVGGDTLYYGYEQLLMSVRASAVDAAGTQIGLALDEGRPQSFAISNGQLLFASADSYNVSSRPLAGGQQLKLGASQGALYFGHRALQVDASNVFWPNGGIQRASLLTTSPIQTQAATSRSTATAFSIDATPTTSATLVYVASDTGDLEVSKLDADQAFWLARGLGSVTSLAIDGANVYIAADCRILTVPR